MNAEEAARLDGWWVVIHKRRGEPVAYGTFGECWRWACKRLKAWHDNGIAPPTRFAIRKYHQTRGRQNG